MNDDLISRQAAIDAMAKHFGTDAELLKGCDINTFWSPAHVLFVLEDLPSAEPKRGRWLKISPANIYECSVCYQNVMTEDIEEYHFCHHCGADMREPK